jgi:hypothetical protein
MSATARADDNPPKDVVAARQAEENAKVGTRWGQNRRIKSHLFLAPSLIPSALVTSYVGQRTVGELIETPNVPYLNKQRFDLDQGRIAEHLDVGVRIVDRVQAFVTLTGIADSSTTGESLVLRGSNYILGAQGGVLVKLFQIAQSGTQLSLRGRIAGQSGKVFSLLPFLTALDEAPARSAVAVLNTNLRELLVSPFSMFAWGADLPVAQPLGRMFSLQASIGITIESDTLRPYNLIARGRQDVDFSTTRPEAGIALTWDAMALRVPVALMLEYLGSIVDVTNDETDKSASSGLHMLALGVYYSGRTDLQLGLIGYGEIGAGPIELFAADGPVHSEDNTRRVGGQFVLRYFW